MLEDKINYYESTKLKLKNTPAQYKNEFPWLCDVDAFALCNAQMNLQKAYENFFRDPKVGFPKFKSKKSNRFSYTASNLGKTIRIQEGKLRLPKIGLVKIKIHRELPNGKIKSATISKTPSGKYYASILCEFEKEISNKELNNFIGLDFAMSELYVDSNGQSANYPKYYKNTQKKLAKEQRKMSKMRKGSNNRNKQRIKVARLHEKIANQRKDFLHKLSYQITNEYDCVCIETLNMDGMKRCLKFGKAVSDDAWGKFTLFLDYKLADKGKRLIKIDKWFPSTKTCSNCGNSQDMPMSKRWYSCECGLELARDHNSAINILNEGKRILNS